MSSAFVDLHRHLPQLRRALGDLERQAGLVEHWGAVLADVLGSGGRLVAAGNGGSAAEAQHLTAELVGRFETPDRKPLSAIAVCAETSSLTAIGNDFGFEHAFARQVAAHGREGDVLVLITTSGRSRNLVLAAEAGRAAGMRVWGMTGPVPNPVADLCDEVLAIDVPSTTAVQEAHLVAVHAICAALEQCLAAPAGVPVGMTRLAEAG
ncbi:MAG TPA: SIS domain-containing protein [Kineosporiaceae bacterium]|nr:SIS domain-containing protein [Kineosporiaceae bacterium]